MVRPSRRVVLGSLGGLLTGPLAGTTVVDGQSAASWNWTFGDRDYEFDGLVQTDTGVLVLGRTGYEQDDHPWVVSLDADGDVRWTTTIEVSGSPDAIDAVSDADGYVISGETNQSPERWLVKLDTTGSEQRRERRPGPGRPVDLVRHEGGFLAVGEREYNPPDDSWDVRVRALDPTGASRWDRNYGGGHATSITPWDDGYLIAGSKEEDAWLQAIEADGTPRWAHTYGGVGSERADTALGIENGVVYTGHTNSIPDVHDRPMLVKTTSDGDFVWRRTYDLADVGEIVRHDGGFVVVGQRTNDDSPTWTRVIHFLDSRGRIRETTTTRTSYDTLSDSLLLDDGTFVFAGTDYDTGPWVSAVVLS